MLLPRVPVGNQTEVSGTVIGFIVAGSILAFLSLVVGPIFFCVILRRRSRRQDRMAAETMAAQRHTRRASPAGRHQHHQSHDVGVPLMAHHHQGHDQRWNDSDRYETRIGHHGGSESHPGWHWGGHGGGSHDTSGGGFSSGDAGGSSGGGGGDAGGGSSSN